MVPAPSPSTYPRQKNVSSAVIARQLISKTILKTEYRTPSIPEASLGNRSVGTIGILHRFDRAIPKQIHR